MKRHRHHSRRPPTILQRIEAGVLKLQRQVRYMDTRITKLINDFNDETNAIAARIDALIAAGSDADAIVAGLQPISDRLKALGANPEEPIPPA